MPVMGAQSVLCTITTTITRHPQQMEVVTCEKYLRFASASMRGKLPFVDSFRALQKAKRKENYNVKGITYECIAHV